MTIEIKSLSRGDESVLANVAPDVFDYPVDRDLSIEFLNDPRHHLAVALDERLVVGMASAVHYIHPDKPPELWINEVAVAPTHHRRGIARKMLHKLFEIGRSVGCKEAWVLTERANIPAMNLYASVGNGEPPSDGVMFTFYLDEPGTPE